MLSSRLHGLARRLRTIGDGWRDLRRVLSPCRFSALTLAIVGGALLFVPQGRDLLRIFAEYPLYQLPINILIFFVGFLAFWSFNNWYFARMMLGLAAKESAPGEWTPVQSELARWVPRLAGAAPFWAVSAALLLVWADDPLGPWRRRLLVFGVLFLLIGMLFFKAFGLWRALGTRVARAGGGDSGKPSTAESESPLPVGWFGIPKAVQALALFSAGFAAFLFVVFLFFPVEVAPKLGASAILFAAAASWVPFGSLFVFAGMKLRFPVITLVLLYIVAISFVNDNHAVRVLPAAPPRECAWSEASASGRAARSDPRCPAPSFERHVETWLEELAKDSAGAGDLPIVFVTAEGGGARAAFWTASVLARLQDENPHFSRHLYATSGVSGGSLGSAVFTALLADLDGEGKLRCRLEDDSTGTTLHACAQAILAQDYLSPPLAGMLYQDLVQRFLPFSVPAFDRSLPLERSWEHHWQAVMGSNRFAEPLSELWSRSQRTRLPALILNSTWVETGQRVLTSNLRFRRSPFTDALDLYDELDSSRQARYEPRLSTAVHNSARFSYLSPAGRVVQDGTTTRGHLVDGGYFENSGAATVLDLVLSFERLRRNRLAEGPNPLWSRATPVVIAITNTPLTSKNGLPPPANGLVETRAPISTLFKTREARGNQALAALRSVIEGAGGQFIRFGVRELDETTGSRLPTPLGWYLSDRSRTALDAQLDGINSEGAKARDAVKVLLGSGTR